ncbi:hypothetical protein AN958_01901 [Leucoagaricus sp. SymC.cos]|nr:hypothetical protein AN958_01901 [Leucoagaricus sp. SymC.cos]
MTNSTRNFSLPSSFNASGSDSTRSGSPVFLDITRSRVDDGDVGDEDEGFDVLDQLVDDEDELGSGDRQQQRVSGAGTGAVRDAPPRIELSFSGGDVDVGVGVGVEGEGGGLGGVGVINEDDEIECTFRYRKSSTTNLLKFIIILSIPSISIIEFGLF